MDDVSIDRLVLEIPGLTPADAHELALRVGQQLAASTADQSEYQSSSVTIDLPAQTPGSRPDLGGLANQIVTALSRRIG
jgi:hypothetical protein